MVSLILTQAEVLTRWYLSWLFDSCRNMRSLPVIQVTVYIQILAHYTLITNQKVLTSFTNSCVHLSNWPLSRFCQYDPMHNQWFFMKPPFVCQKNGWAIRYAPPLFRNSEEVCVRGSRIDSQKRIVRVVRV